MQRILIDTNIFIKREDYHVIPEDLQKLMRGLSQRNRSILIHPKSIEDLQRDSNIERMKVALSKIGTYSLLDKPPDPYKNNEFLNIVGETTSPNESVDNWILYAVFKNAVHFLITEDKGIHQKARKLNLKDRVLSINETLERFNVTIHSNKVQKPPALKEEYVYNLDLNDPFFRSLKESYPEFKDWFARISKEGRKCFVHYTEESNIGALLIYKIEEDFIDANPIIPKKKRLKLCTFKAAVLGRKIGELFIKLSVEYSIENDVEEIYLTIFSDKEPYLVKLISEYGFVNTARNTRGEDIYIKPILLDTEELKSLPASKVSKEFWPYFKDGPEIGKFVVPIQPSFYGRLFIESGNRQTSLDEHRGEFIVEGNTIKKAYLCHSKTKKIRPGDVLLFYRSIDQSAITSIGVVEKVYPRLRDSEKIKKLVRKRTVYGDDEIKEMAKKDTMIILFTWHFHLKTPLKLKRLIQLEVLKAAPQSIMQIAHGKYLKALREGKLDERFTVN